MVRHTLWIYLALALVQPAGAVTPPVTISPTTATMRAGSPPKQFSAMLTGVAGPVVWFVNSVNGGNATVGTITSTGLYTLPLANPGATLTVRATAGGSHADAVVTWENPDPSIASFSPAAVNVGTFTVTVNGAGFVAGSQIHLNGSPVTTSFVSSTALKFQATVNTASSLSVAVANPAPGPSMSNSRTLNVMPPITLTLTPPNAQVRLGTTKKFAANIENAVDESATWGVNGVVGGTAATGMIASDGTYTAPTTMPAGAIAIGVSSVESPGLTGHSQVTLLNPTPVIQTVTPNPMTYGGPQTITIHGTGFVAGSQIEIGSTMLTTQFVSSTQLTASTTVEPVTGGFLTFHVKNPNPGASTSAVAIVPGAVANPKTTYLGAARFLEQASWGPDAAEIAHVQSIGMDAWITEQMTEPVSFYKASTDSSTNLVNQQAEFFTHAMSGKDQLRQRVAFALGQIFVVSGLKTGEPRQMVPYQNMLLNDAFGTYANILRDVTLSPTMGVYLDMVNNDKANAANGTAPNENYGREVMQLFSIGTSMLGLDGSTLKDSSGNPILTYDQSTITGMAHALTGWTFPGKVITQGHNGENYTGPMIPVEANHDEGAKTIVGGMLLPAGHTAQQDLDDVLHALSTHPNIAPFICLRLIEHLVMSNPSPQYMQRMTTVFNNSGGNLGATVRAILLDPEARQGDNLQAPVQVSGGHLREPVLFTLAMMKALNASVVTQNPVAGLASDMGQNLFYPGSVFNYYSPLYRSGALLAPEFQGLNSSTALVRANVVQNLVARGLDGDAHFDLSPFTRLNGNVALMVDAIDNAFMYGRMPATLKADIVTVIKASTSSNDRVRNAIYLIATSALYQVQH